MILPRVGGAVGVGGQGRLAGMLEDAKVDGALVRLDAPGDGVLALDVDPAHEIGLSEDFMSACWLSCYGTCLPGHRGRTLLWISSSSMPAMAAGD